MAIVFPDIEPLLVAHIKQRLDDINTTVSADVSVSTRKLQPGADQPDKQVVIVGSYGATLDELRREAAASIDIWASDYATASELALLVAAVVVTIPGDQIKRSVVALGPVRLNEDGPDEHRAISVDLIVKGSEL